MWTYLILTLILGLIFGIAATRILLDKKLKVVEQINVEVRRANERAKKEFEVNKAENMRAQADLVAARKEQDHLNENLAKITTQIVASQEDAKVAANDYYQKALEAVRKNISLDIEELEAQYTKAERDFKQEYLKTLEASMVEYEIKTEHKKQQLEELDATLKDAQEKVNAAVEANKRAAEIVQQKDFYRLVLSEVDLEEIKKLRSVTPYLRNSEPLNKVIWKVYYERPYTDLIGRVIGSGSHCGIYKITNMENGMCYVGQAVNIADRWKQHIKRGVGADPPTRNKLYPAMLSTGVENFTFEIIEECSREQLNEREQYWQDYFKAKEFGYSIK